MKNELKIHKKLRINTVFDETMVCGIPWFAVSPRHTFHWKNVTCKNCLKLRKEQEK